MEWGIVLRYLNSILYSPVAIIIVASVAFRLLYSKLSGLIKKIRFKTPKGIVMDFGHGNILQELELDKISKEKAYYYIGGSLAGAQLLLLTLSKYDVDEPSDHIKSSILVSLDRAKEILDELKLDEAIDRIIVIIESIKLNQEPEKYGLLSSELGEFVKWFGISISVKTD